MGTRPDLHTPVTCEYRKVVEIFKAARTLQMPVTCGGSSARHTNRRPGLNNERGPTSGGLSPEDDEVSASASWLVHHLSGKDLPSAMRVEEPVEGPILTVDLFDDVLLCQHPPDGHEPLLPLAWAVWLVLGVQ